MAETIVLVEGSKVRQDGQTYRVVNSSVIDGELVPVKTQKNRHAIFGCVRPECHANEPVMRCGASGSLGSKWPMGSCGQCGDMYRWKGSDGNPTDTREGENGG